MKTITHLSFSIGIVSLCLAWPAQGQTPFQNLDFSAAQIPPGTPSDASVPIDQAFPGWSGTIGSTPVTMVSYGLVAFNFPGLTLPGPPSNIASPPSGSLEAVVVAGAGPSGIIPVSLAQTGFIPVTASSLVFTALPSQVFNQVLQWTVSIDGQNIPVTQEAGPDNAYYSYAGDISSFAGKTAQLQFTALGSPALPGVLAVTDISFSPNPVPEPGTCTLILGGVALYTLARRIRVL